MATPLEHYIEVLSKRIGNRKNLEKKFEDIHNQATYLRAAVKSLNEDLSAVLEEVEGLLNEMKKG